MQKRTVGIAGLAGALVLTLGVLLGVLLSSSPGPATRPASSGTVTGLTAEEILRQLEPITMQGLRCNYILNDMYAIGSALSFRVTSQAVLENAHGNGNGCFTVLVSANATKMRTELHYAPAYVVGVTSSVQWPTPIVGANWVLYADNPHPLGTALLARIEQVTGGSPWHFYQSCSGQGVQRVCLWHGAPG